MLKVAAHKNSKKPKPTVWNSAKKKPTFLWLRVQPDNLLSTQSHIWLNRFCLTKP